ncbi:hypothetical protein G7Y89_g4749 [Cudoniella acicularis]|uniref:Heterokaryon incompatibility domain-containing protein n=1 Tax=Cudoniella acicularis TaxID=354080 RepID=A0A8H4W4E7_9HELO|nr:hypothetical protein G7Y89_g4749 [Cudoniella acicularis]
MYGFLCFQPLDDVWDIYTDNNFASAVISRIKNSASLMLPELRESASLCSSCQDLDFFGSLGFSIEYKPGDLEEGSKNCDLCGLFWRTYQRNNGNRASTVRFEKDQPLLKMNGIGHPVLSICRNLDPKAQPSIQIGLPKLPEAGSETHFGIIRQWLQLCDDKVAHPKCKATSTSTSCLPTRLIDVGKEGEDIVRLWVTSPEDTAEYIALSHPWGKGPHFVTNVKNLEEHKEGIKLTDLPATFRDAIITTRALDKRCLWVDSICIIQGPDGDFEAEAKKMENVFNSAYCVIAASRSHSHIDGFLQGRREREYVTIRKRPDEAPFYICENIDNFNLHVLNGHLNKRGWVLQEHALARRTIFFTEHQTYWECGNGVRCETLTKMSNNLAVFLGDPNFPQIIMSANRGEKIVHFQSLYKTYSSLAFANQNDRPIAVDGIQNRLLKAFETQGGFGIFDEDRSGQSGLLRRSLLWYRPLSNTEPVKNAFLSSRTTTVPSWSWMACLSEIDYLKLGFGNIDWMEIQSPWSGKDDGVGNIALSGKVRAITVDAAGEKIGELYFDMPGELGRSSLQCVVLGVEQGHRPQSTKFHYFILVNPMDMRRSDGSEVYERVGAGYLPGRCIPSEGYRSKIR